LEGENLQEKKVESTLDEVRWLAHRLSSVTEGMIHKTPLGKQGES
jgi:hypothetical protein